MSGAGAALPVVIRWAGCCLLVVAGRQILGPAAVALHAGRSLCGRLAGAYDASPAGRRLLARLESASIAIHPAGYRRLQVVVAVTVLATLVVAGADWLVAVGLASLASRLGGVALLRMRRGARDRVFEQVVPEVARALALELAAGATSAEAVAAARAGGSAARPATRSLLDAIAARTAAGESLPEAVRRVAAVEPAAGAARSLGLLSETVDMTVGAGAGSGLMIRLAEGLEAEARVRAEARAAVVEGRLGAVAVPAIALLVGVTVALSSPSAAAAAVALPIAPLLVLCVAIAATGSLLAGRLTRF